MRRQLIGHIVRYTTFYCRIFFSAYHTLTTSLFYTIMWTKIGVAFLSYLKWGYDVEITRDLQHQSPYYTLKYFTITKVKLSLCSNSL